MRNLPRVYETPVVGLYKVVGKQHLDPPLVSAADCLVFHHRAPQGPVTTARPPGSSQTQHEHVQRTYPVNK